MGQKTSRRALRGTAIGFGILAMTAASAAPAGAALAGGKAASLSNVPSIRSVTVSGNQATYTYDRSVKEPVTASFLLRTYGLNTPAGQVNATGAVASGSSVVVQYRDASDLARASVAQIAAGAVKSTVNDRDSLADAQAVTGGTSVDGTRGSSSAPRLDSVRAASGNRLIYQFDRKLAAGAPAAASFEAYTAGGGAPITGTPSAVQAGDTTVSVTFAAAIDPARVAVLEGAVESIDFQVPSSVGGTAVAGSPGVTGAPDLTAAVVQDRPGATQTVRIAYTFDQAVAAGSQTAANFRAYYANGNSLGAGTIIDAQAGSTVVVEYAAAPTGSYENVVSAGVVRGAATNSDGLQSPTNLVPVGGNAGASASGWTIAPDVVSVRATNEPGEFAAVIDTRVATGGFGGLPTFYDATGAPVTVVSAVSEPTGLSVGRTTVTYKVTPTGNAATVSAASFPAGAFTGTSGVASPAQVIGVG